MIWNLEEPMVVQAPSDIKIKITEIRDAHDNVVDMQRVYIMFVFADPRNNEYRAVYDPNGVNTLNTKYDGTEGVLKIMIQNYGCLRGQLTVKVGTKSVDEDFTDGMWDWWNKRENSKITIEGC